MKWVDTSDGTVHENCVVFYKTKEMWGGLSNMAGGYPIQIDTRRLVDNGPPKKHESKATNMRTAEALYQACRYPYRPDLQQVIIDQASPIAAKMKAKANGRRDELTRPDWYDVRVDVMYWCLRVKLACNAQSFGELLAETGRRQIVEKSRKDDYWGAKEDHDGVLHGENVLGKQLMKLRDSREKLLVVEPMAIKDFLLLGGAIMTIDTSPPRKWQAGDTAWRLRICTADGENDCLFAVKVEITSIINRATALVKVLGWDSGRVEEVFLGSLYTLQGATDEIGSIDYRYSKEALERTPDFVYPGFKETSDNWLSPLAYFADK